jgi:protein-L-isoaspartate(D-aspartate) O-methyltransferase
MAITLPALKRKELVEKIIHSGIKNEKVLEAIGNVKREFFVNDEFKRYAYDNNALPINCSQTISQPYTVAFMTELLEIKEGNKILEIGTGSGYQAAVLKELGAEVYSIEKYEELYLKAKSTLENLNYKVFLKCGDGSKGWSEFAPYDGIIVTAGSPKIPEVFIEQLAPGGRLVIPVGDSAVQKIWQLKKSTRRGDDRHEIKKFSDFKFVPLQWEEGWR